MECKRWAFSCFVHFRFRFSMEQTLHHRNEHDHRLLCPISWIKMNDWRWNWPTNFDRSNGQRISSDYAIEMHVDMSTCELTRRIAQIWIPFTGLGSAIFHCRIQVANCFREMKDSSKQKKIPKSQYISSDTRESKSERMHAEWSDGGENERKRACRYIRAKRRKKQK